LEKLDLDDSQLLNFEQMVFDEQSAIGTERITWMDEL
jgi:hypothetical protein